MPLLAEVRSLVKAELYSSVRMTVSLMLDSFIDDVTKYEVLVYLGDALVQDAEFRKAEKVYHRALQIRHEVTLRQRSQESRMMGAKSAPPSSRPDPGVIGSGRPSIAPTRTSSEPLSNLPASVSEPEVKFRLHRCLIRLQRTKDALMTLETIPNRKRSPKISMALASLYEDTGQERAATQSYKEVVRENPLALAAIQGLIRLEFVTGELTSMLKTSLADRDAEDAKKEKGDDVNDSDRPSLLSSSWNLNDGDWISRWVRGHAGLQSGDFPGALASFDNLATRPVFRNCVPVLVAIGQTHYMMGHYDLARSTLESVRFLDPFQLVGMDSLASLLYKAKLFKELESLALSLMEVGDQAPEAWIAMGYVSRSQKKVKRAVYLAQKAWALSHRNVEALILKGAALLDIKRVNDAVIHFREALRISPKLFEAHHGLIGCYLGQRRMREAIAQAKEALYVMGHTARSMTIYGTVLAKEPLMADKAKTYLERALKVDPLHVAAVYPLAEIFASLREFQKGADLLKKQLTLQSNPKLHQIYGDFLSQLKDFQEASNQYGIALSLDPTNQRALEGMQRVEKASESGLGGIGVPAFEVEAVSSDHEAELSDGPEGGEDWSDNDFN